MNSIAQVILVSALVWSSFVDGARWRRDGDPPRRCSTNDGRAGSCIPKAECETLSQDEAETKCGPRKICCPDSREAAATPSPVDGKCRRQQQQGARNH